MIIKKTLLERLKSGEVLLSDGALGTMLMERGLKSGECPELMNIHHPEIVSEVARFYLEAGSQLISTNTFGASPLKLSMYSLAEKVEEINFSAVQILRNLAGERAYIMASCGPTGKLLKPYGDTEPETIFQAFKTQATCLAKAGIDAFLFETMTDLVEASLAIKAAKEVAPEIPVIATMTFDKTPKGFFTIMGVNISKAAQSLEWAGADIIGSNCGNGIENMVSIAREFKRVSELPIIIQSNAGLPELINGKAVYKESPELMAEKAEELLNARIAIIGGCCGTTPKHISALKNLLDSRDI